MKYRYLIVIALYFNLYQAFCQIQEKAIPFSASEGLSAVTSFVDLPVDCFPCKTGSLNEESLQFACPIDTDFDPVNSGQWVETTKGHVWRLGIRSEGAYSLYVHMEYFLSEGTLLYVYSPGYKDLIGAFSNHNNHPGEVLAISPVPGEQMIIELNVPADKQDFGKIRITKVFHDYLGVFESSNDNLRISETRCYEGINSGNGRLWQTEKRAVCQVISNGRLGTGTLVGNTSGDSSPYLLTAHHLISTEEEASEAIFLFNYEREGSQGEQQGIPQSLTGATLLSTTDHQLDFSLLRLKETPPPSYNTFYAGWDASGERPETGVCIHHPIGGPKEIALEYHPIKDEDIGEGFDVNSTWKVSHWELGTTEEGSSGAPLFDENHRLVGTLTGGRSTCGYPKDDYFTRLSVSWDKYEDQANQLKFWLDPIGTDQRVLEGYDPYGFRAEFCDTVWNLYSYDQLQLSNENLDWGWLSGHSSANYTQFAERFESAGTIQINGVFLDVAKAFAANSLAFIELKIWEGLQYPESEAFSQLLFLKDLQPDAVNYVALDTILSVSGSFFVGYRINYEAAMDTFALYHAVDRGYTRPSSMVVYANGTWYQSKNEMDCATSLGLGLSACYGSIKKVPNDLLNLYPNPCSNFVSLDVPGGVPILDVKCFDSSGQQVKVYLNQNEENNILNFNLVQGMYILKVITEFGDFTSKLIIQE